MNDIFIYITLGFILLLFILSSIIYKRLRIWKLILVFLTGSAYIVLKFFPEYITFIDLDKASEYYQYFVFLVMIVISITFKNKIKITQVCWMRD
jgi:NhaP-type Na+/H+ or K+/H+ antiporter